MRSLLPVFGLMLLLLEGCGGKSSAPLRLYFIGSGRFTTGGRTLTQPDTLATRLYATVDETNPAGLQHFTATVSYTPLRAPFAYPNPLSLFSYGSLGGAEPVIYLDTLLTAGTRELLYTQVFGSRTTSGSERWEYVVTDGTNTVSRAFTLAVRRPDSLLTYHDYTLNLDAGAGGAARRFVQLRGGLALPAYAVVPKTPSASNQQQQALTDLIVPAGGTYLVAPSNASAGLGARWDLMRRRETRFVLTALTDTDLGQVRDTTAIRQLFVGLGATRTPTLVARQVYAFRTADQPRPTFGLLLVQALPSGTTQGLRLRVLIAKQLR